MPTAELSESRKRLALHFGGAVAIACAGLWLLNQPGRDTPSIKAGVAFFAVCIALLGWRLVRPQRLTLDENGFRLSGGLVLFSRKILWREVEEFLIFRPGKRMIGYRYKPSAGKNSYWTMLNRMFGADGGLAGEWPLPLDQVVDELNARLDRHNSTASPN